MRAFNLKNLVFILSSITLSACTLPKPEKQQGTEASTYSVDSFEGKSATEEFIQDFSIPGSRTYNYKLCLKDLLRGKPITGHDFHINETSQDVKTDASGCLNWSEKIKYNFLSQSHYLEQDRTIVANGIHRGSQSIRFAINPWSHGEATVEALDLNKKTVPFLLDNSDEIRMNLLGIDSSSKKSNRKLWLDTVNMTVSNDRLNSNGINLSYQLRSSPQILMSKLNGDAFKYDLNQGIFNAKVTLISQQYIDGQIQRRPLEMKEFKNIRVNNGQLNLIYDSNLEITPQIGQLFLAINLAAESGPQGLNPFDGLYPIGDYKNIKTSNYLRLTSEATKDDFKIDNFLTQRNILSANIANTETTTGFQKAKVEIDHLVFNQIRRGEENNTNKELIYKVKACLKSGVDQDSLRRLKFKVTKFKQDSAAPSEIENLETDNTSCLNWFEKIQFKYYDCQHYFKGFVTIQNSDLGMNEKIEYIVNPWDAQSTFALDIRDTDPKDNYKQFCSSQKNMKGQLMVDSYNYSTLSYSYDIDQNLNMAVHKKIQFKTEPRVLIYSDMTNGIMQSEKLRDGPYFLRIVVVRNQDYDSNNTYVTHVEKLVNVLNGQINTDLELISQDLRATGNRNTMLMQIQPVQSTKVIVNTDGTLAAKSGVTNFDSIISKDANIDSGVFAGPILINNSKGSENLRALDQSALAQYLVSGIGGTSKSQQLSLQQIIQTGLSNKAQQLKYINQTGDIKTYALKNNLIYGSAVDRTFLNNIDRNTLKKIALTGKIDKNAMTQLCNYWFHSVISNEFYTGTANYIIPECARISQKDNGSFFTTENHILVKKLGAFKYLQGARRDLSVGTNFNLSNNTSESYTTTSSVSANAGLSFKPLEFVSLGVSGSYSMSWSNSETKSKYNSVSVNEGQKLNVQENRFSLRLDQYEKCVVIRLQPNLFKDKNDHWWQALTQFNLANYFDKNISTNKKIDAARRGVMICSGQTETTPIEKIEKYYLVNQDNMDADQQDAGDQRNRNMFIALRGETDYNHFTSMLKAKLQFTATANADDSSGSNVMGEALEKLFNTSPSAPGHIVN